MAAKRKICSPKIKCVLLQNRFREKESIEKDALLPYSVDENLDTSLM